MPDARLAADIVWLDAFTTNVDRTPRNPNLLIWHDRLWLIDHGAALYLQHGGLDPAAHADKPFPLIAEHVLLPCAGSIVDAHERLAQRSTGVARRRRGPRAGGVARGGDDPDTYVDYLSRRLRSGSFATEAEAERARPGA